MSGATSGAMSGAIPPPERPWPVRRVLRKLLPWLLVLAALAALPAWRLLVPVPALSHRVERGTLRELAYGRGTLEPVREAQLGFDLVGTLGEVHVDEGDRVRLGQELARLWPEPFEAERRTAVLGVEAARAALGRLAAEEAKARDVLARADREEARTRALVDEGAVPAQELDLARDESRIASAELDRVLAARRESSRAIDVAAGSAAERRVSELRATLLAPFDGIVVRRFRDPGDALTVGSTVLRLVDGGDLFVRAWVDETALPRLAEGQTVDLRFPGEPERRYAGRVIRVGQEVDRQTQELLVDVSLDERPSRLAIGQRVDAWIEIGRREDVVVLPLAWLRREEGASHVLVDRDGRAERRALTLGTFGREAVEAVEVVAGLEAGDVVLVSPRSPVEAIDRRRWREAP